MFSRRSLLLGLCSGALTGVVAKKASATIMRAVSLPQLVKSSGQIAVVTALSAESHYEVLGRRQRIVTDTRVRVEERLVAGANSDSELMVRTLGGSVGDAGELVHGQARLALGEPCVAFLLQAPDGLQYMNGMSQGHYPLRGNGSRVLAQSPDLPEIIGIEASAVHVLVGSRLEAATSLVRKLSAP